MESDYKLKLALRIQKRILSETRKSLAEAQQALVQEQTGHEMTRTLVEHLNTQLHDLPNEIKSRNIEIEMLQKRLTNLNNEFNGIRRPTETARAVQDHRRHELEKWLIKSKRQVTTSEDVYKLTGESYSKDDHRS